MQRSMQTKTYNIFYIYQKVVSWKVNGQGCLDANGQNSSVPTTRVFYFAI